MSKDKDKSWEHLSINIGSTDEREAEWLAQVIVETLQDYREKGWQLENMISNEGTVIINFRKPRIARVS